MNHILPLPTRKRWLRAATLLVGLLPGAALAQTTTFSYTGGTQSYTVPVGVTRIQVVATGAAGSVYDNTTTYGLGATVTATLTVVPGEVLTVRVGGQGGNRTASTTAGGYNGGGVGYMSGSGGGATDLLRAASVGATGDYSSRNALLVAGGAGGSAQTNYTVNTGGAGGTPTGGNGGNDGNPGSGGSGATQTAAGAGATTTTTTATAGTAGVGGTGDNTGGGGGGGGYYGGGGGGDNMYWGGGGGGSSWVSGSALVGTASYGTAGSAANGQLAITVLAPTITAFAPSPGGLGQVITLTGTNLSGISSLVVNGVAATASISNNTATSVTFRVPATAPATGTTTVTTSGGTATSTALQVMPAPGNALAFDGTNDYVALPTTTAVPTANSAYTLEAWIKPTTMGVEGIIGWGSYGNTNQVNALRLTPNGLVNYWWANDLQVTTGDLTGRWHHVAATFDGTTRTLYLDGVAVGSDTPTGHSVPSAANLRLGSTNGGEYFSGSIDEVRVWSVARTSAQVQADMRSAATVPTSGLVTYFNMDQGTPGGTNTGLSTAYDLVSAVPGTLTNFALSGSTSNWVESYAMVVPTATAATLSATSNSSFGATWTAPAVGIVTTYILDVATTTDFSSGLVSGSPFTVAGTATTQNVTSLVPGTTYYYRVRANKTSVTGQGMYSNVSTVTLPTTLSCAQVSNALNFDGSSDYVHVASTLPAGSELTLETWVYPETFNSSTGFSAVLNVDNYGTGAIHFQFLNSGALRVGISGLNDMDSPFTVPLNTWSHVAIVYSATTRTLKFYLNGALQSTVAASGSVAITAQPYSLGGWLNNGTPTRFLDGSLNELRVWSVARTDAQIAASYNQALTAQAGLAALYSFDQGTPGGTNTSLTTLNDDSGNNRTGVLNTFALTGNSSNWVAGNSLTAAFALTSFSPANGSMGGTVTLTGTGLIGATGVSFNGVAASTFTVISNTTLTAIIPAGATTGLVSVAGTCGTVSSSGVFMVCPTPVASTQNASLTLGANGTASVSAAALNNNSTPTSCGTLTATVQKIMTGYASENGTITLTAPVGMVFTSVIFASYGTPTSNGNGTYTINSGCHSSLSQSVVEAALLNKNTGTIVANNATFGDPCGGTVKRLAVLATYGPAAPAAQLTYTCAELGTNQALLTITDASGVSSTAVATVAVSVPTGLSTTTWLGATSADWYDCRNWSYGQGPTAAISAVIPSGTAYTPLISSSMATVNSLTMMANGNLALAPSATLQVSGDWTSNSTNSSFAGTLAFVGTATQTIANTGTPFSNVQINKNSGTAQLGQHMAVGTSLVMARGLLATGSYQVQLGSSATLTESEATYVVGTATATRTLSAGTTEVFGGLGLSLTPASGSVAPGSTTVARTTGTALTGAGTSQSVLRYFNITPTTNTGLDVTLMFSYFNHELNSIPAANLLLFKSTTSPSGPWANMGKTTSDATSVTKTGLTDFSIWTLGSSANPLPVVLLDFTATAQGAAVALAWHTASEAGSDRFEVERSLDGITFTKLGTLAAHGTTTTAQAYAYRDARLPSGVPLLYYRLRQVDFDGSAHYSPVRTVAVAATGLALFPNPTHAAATLTGAAPSTTVHVLNTLGQVVLATTTDAAGTATLALPAGLPAGVYVVRAGRQATRLTVE